jgi:hypothetical protein
MAKDTSQKDPIPAKLEIRNGQDSAQFGFRHRVDILLKGFPTFRFNLQEFQKWYGVSTIFPAPKVGAGKLRCIGILALPPSPDGPLIVLLTLERTVPANTWFSVQRQKAVRILGASSSHATRCECRKG